MSELEASSSDSASAGITLSESRGPGEITQRDGLWPKVWLVLALVLWILPLFYCGSRTGKLSFLPRQVTVQYDCAALFTLAPRTWTQCCYLIKAGTNESWQEVPREVVSPMPVAGYRQRMDRIVSDVRSKKFGRPILHAIAVDVARKYEETFPNQAKVTAVKIVNTEWRTDELVMNCPVGRWRLPPAELINKWRAKPVILIEKTTRGWKDEFPSLPQKPSSVKGVSPEMNGGLPRPAGSLSQATNRGTTPAKMELAKPLPLKLQPALPTGEHTRMQPSPAPGAASAPARNNKLAPLMPAPKPGPPKSSPQ